MADCRFVMNVKGIGSALIPRGIFQRQLKTILKEILNSNQLEDIVFRANYYNKKNEFFDIKKYENYEKIGKMPFKKTSLAYDAYKISKYFNDEFLWIKAFKDIAYDLKDPSITKSRPIVGGVNNIILKLDKNRHFDFIKDYMSFEDKKDIVFFRGGVYQPHRIKFFEKNFNNKYCDIAHVGKKDERLLKWMKNLNFKVSRAYQTNFKFLLSLEGNDVASNLKWAMNTNSLVLAPKMKVETWFMEGKLIPNEHFALINEEYDNINELVEFYLSHPDKAKELVLNAHSYIEQFLDEKIEFYIGILVLAKYFYYSNQLDLPKDIIDLFN